MAYPPLLNLNSSAEYRAHFENIYCRRPLMTFDNIAVRFGKSDFNHCFFESVNAKDDTFSPQRAQRMDWIKAALEDATAELYVGWDNARKCEAKDRRVAIVMTDFVVIIRVTDATCAPKKAEFVTCYHADSGRTLQLIRSGRKWQ